MCEYCENGKSIKSVNWNGTGQINIDKKETYMEKMMKYLE